MNIIEIQEKFGDKAKDVIGLITTDNAVYLKSIIKKLGTEEAKIEGLKAIAKKIKDPKEKEDFLKLADLSDELKILKKILND